MGFITQHKLMTVGAIIFVLIVGWFVLSSSSPTDTTNLVASSGALAGQGATGIDDQKLLTTLVTLRAVKLDNSIFSDPGFQQLQDFSTPIVPEPVGRSDPFAPLTAVAAPTTGSTQAAQIFKPQN